MLVLYGGGVETLVCVWVGWPDCEGQKGIRGELRLSLFAPPRNVFCIY